MNNSVCFIITSEYKDVIMKTSNTIDINLFNSYTSARIIYFLSKKKKKNVIVIDTMKGSFMKNYV